MNHFAKLAKQREADQLTRKREARDRSESTEPVIQLQVSRPLIPRREIPGVFRRLTGGAKKPHEQTVRRWYSRGVCVGKDQPRVTLDVTYVGGEVFTTVAAVKEFIAITTTKRRRKKRRPSLTPKESALAMSADVAMARIESLTVN